MTIHPSKTKLPGFEQKPGKKANEKLIYLGLKSTRYLQLALNELSQEIPALLGIRLETQNEHWLRIRCTHQTPTILENDPNAIDRENVTDLWLRTAGLVCLNGLM